MNQNRNPNRQSSSAPMQRPAAGRQGAAPQRPVSRPVTARQRRKKRSPIPLIILLIVFLISGGFYVYEFLIPHESTVPAGGRPDGEIPSGTDSGTNDTDTTTEGSGSTAEPPADTDPPGSTDSSATQPDTPPAAYTVVLDPGHGFGDVGTTSDYLGGVYESSLTLDMCQMIEKILSENGVTVLYTHNGKTFPLTAELDRKAASLSYSMEAFARELIRNHGFDKNGNAVNENSTWDRFSSNLSDAGTGSNLFNVYERAYYINLLAKEQAVDAMVSVHVNSVNLDDPAVNLEVFHGYTVSYSNCNDYEAKSSVLQDRVSDSLAAHFPQKRVVRYSDPWYDSLVILKYSAVPAILVETGYCVQPDEAADLLSEEWRGEMAEAIANGVLAYLGVTPAP